jgi:hypothetical protein
VNQSKYKWADSSETHYIYYRIKEIFKTLKKFRKCPLILIAKDGWKSGRDWEVQKVRWWKWIVL